MVKKARYIRDILFPKSQEDTEDLDFIERLLMEGEGPYIPLHIKKCLKKEIKVYNKEGKILYHKPHYLE